MINLIYNFINNVFIGSTEIEGANDLAILLTFATLIAIFFILWRVVRWAFGLGKIRKWR